MYVFHGLFSAASKRGCDLILLAEWGNFTFSDKGDWGFIEYLFNGKWRQLWLALTRLRNDDRSIVARFMARTLSALRSVLTETRRRGHATEIGEVTPGSASVAAPVLDHNGHPVAGIAVTYQEAPEVDVPALAEAVLRASTHLTQRLGGHS